MLSLALVVAAIVATPVERTNGVISTLYREDYSYATKGNIHLTAVNRGCLGCKGSLSTYPHPYHDERRGLMKRSPLFPFPFPLAKKKKKPLKIPFKKAPLFGKKGLKKAKPFGKKGLKKAKPLGKKAIKKGVPASALGGGGIGIPTIRDCTVRLTG